MKKLTGIIFFIILILITQSSLFSLEFTQEDRDKLIRLETKLEEGQITFNNRFEFIQKQIDDLKTFMLWGFGILFAGMGILIGFVIWDRRTA